MIFLCYFNPIGAHPSGILGECPAGKSQNLMANAVLAILGQIPHLVVYRDDYDTHDGTGRFQKIYCAFCRPSQLQFVTL